MEGWGGTERRADPCALAFVVMTNLNKAALQKRPLMIRRSTSGRRSEGRREHSCHGVGQVAQQGGLDDRAASQGSHALLGGQLALESGTATWDPSSQQLERAWPGGSWCAGMAPLLCPTCILSPIQLLLQPHACSSAHSSPALLVCLQHRRTQLLKKLHEVAESRTRACTRACVGGLCVGPVQGPALGSSL